MPVYTKRWNDPKDRNDGVRLLVTRFRPRGLKKEDETWDAWWKELGPSTALHAAYYGKTGAPIGWEAYRERYLDEMLAQTPRIAQLVERVAQGETLTLLCSSACVDASRCHRTLLKGLLEEKLSEKPKDGHHAS